MPTFRMLKAFNQPKLTPLARSSSRLDKRALPYFASDTMVDRLMRELAIRRALPVKEVTESFEFFARVRKKLRGPIVVDLCCGHGLVGLLFALLEPSVEKVVLFDKRCPQSYATVLEALTVVGPWAASKVEFRTGLLSGVSSWIAPGSSVFSVHACGIRTDATLQAAVEAQGKLAVMPCCYMGLELEAPPAVINAIGIELAADIDRSYRLEKAGYRVEWTSIPEVITPKNRVLIGRVATPALLERGAHVFPCSLEKTLSHADIAPEPQPPRDCRSLRSHYLDEHRRLREQSG